jgi:hypothetical protein
MRMTKKSLRMCEVDSWRLSHDFYGSRARALAIRFLQKGHYDDSTKTSEACLAYPREPLHRSSTGWLDSTTSVGSGFSPPLRRILQ